MIDAAYRQCVELTLQYTQVHFRVAASCFARAPASAATLTGGATASFFMIGNLSADHPNLIPCLAEQRLKSISTATSRGNLI